eukprot:scaffold86005_cov57-Phaeocystis_antarctica.AAC.1
MSHGGGIVSRWRRATRYRQWRANHRGRVVFSGSLAHLTGGPSVATVPRVLADGGLPVAPEPAASTLWPTLPWTLSTLTL